MSEGGIEQYKGKNLDEIDIDMTPVVEEENMIDSLSTLEEDSNVKSTSSANLNIPIKKKNEIVRCKWTNREKQQIANYFSDHIKEQRAPKRAEVEAFVERHPGEFHNRKWTSIKAVVFNIFTNKLKVL